MAARAKKVTAGMTDAQIFKLKCPGRTCNANLQVVNYRIGDLDKIRGIHHVTSYGWFARCPECGEQYGDETTFEPSMWVLKDKIEELASGAARS